MSLLRVYLGLSHLAKFPQYLVRRNIQTTAVAMSNLPRRTLLYVPGDSLKMIKKAQTLEADVVCLDIEDGVSALSKSKARDSIVEVLESKTDFGMSELAVRINSISSGLADEDLSAIFSCKSPPSTLVVPKVDTVEDVNWLMAKLKCFASTEGLNLITQVESAQALVNMADICRTITRDISNYIAGTLVAVIFGSDDYCASIGATRSASGVELLYPRQKIVAVAKAFNAQAIDMVHIDLKDLDGLKKYSQEGAAMGFTGKQVIHPSQLEIVNECFAPSEEKVAWANELIEAFNQHSQKEKGAFVFKNQMIDKPSLLQAENLKNMAEMIRKRRNH